MRLLLLPALLVIAACSSTPDPGGVVRGEVVSVDTAPLAYDGSAIIMVRTDAGEQRVTVPARINLCEATEIASLSELRPGDRVEVRGETSSDGSVTPCTSADHFLRVVG